MTTELMVFAPFLIGLTFAVSALGKARDVAAFAETVAAFKVLPQRWSKAAARVLLGVEVAVVLLMFARRAGVVTALCLAAVLLVAYTSALAAVLLRGAAVGCDCFGTSSSKVSWADLVRNAVLLAAAVAGTVALSAGRPMPTVADSILVALAAVFTVLVLVNLGDVAAVVRAPITSD